MSIDIPQHHVQQYKDNVFHLSQQKMSRLRRTVTDDGDIVGDRVFFDRLGQTAAQKVTTRHADTPLMNTPHSRRMAVMEDHDWGDLVDKTDTLKTIYDPTNKYAQAASAALARSTDDVIIAALGGTAYEGKTGATAVALPAAQKIAVGATGLTVAKLRTAKKLLDKAEVDEMIPRYFVTNAEGIEDLLSDTNVTSADYNTVKALVAGTVNQFMGFEFIRIERLLTDGSGSRLCYAYAKTAIGFGSPLEPNVDIGPRRDKRNAIQVYASMSLGAVRREDVQVVEVAIAE